MPDERDGTRRFQMHDAGVEGGAVVSRARHLAGQARKAPRVQVPIGRAAAIERLSQLWRVQIVASARAHNVTPLFQIAISRSPFARCARSGPRP